MFLRGGTALIQSFSFSFTTVHIVFDDESGRHLNRAIWNRVIFAPAHELLHWRWAMYVCIDKMYEQVSPYSQHTSYCIASPSPKSSCASTLP